MFDAYLENSILSDIRCYDASALARTVNDIYCHGANVDDFLTSYTPYNDENHYLQVLNELAAREAGYASYQEAIDDKADVEAYEEDIIGIKYFSIYSNIAEALADYYDCTKQDLAKHARSGYYDTISGNIFFVTGIGYSTVDKDLLGGNGDDHAEDAFLARYDN